MSETSDAVGPIEATVEGREQSFTQFVTDFAAQLMRETGYLVPETEMQRLKAELDQAQAALDALHAYTEQEWELAAAGYNAQFIGDWRTYVDSLPAIKHRLELRIRQVVAWQPPDVEFESLRSDMLDDLSKRLESIDEDIRLGQTPYQPSPAPSLAEYKEMRIRQAQEVIENHRWNYDRWVRKNADTAAWLKTLRSTLPPEADEA